MEDPKNPKKFFDTERQQPEAEGEAEGHPWRGLGCWRGPDVGGLFCYAGGRASGCSGEKVAEMSKIDLASVDSAATGNVRLTTGAAWLI